MTTKIKNSYRSFTEKLDSFKKWYLKNIHSKTYISLVYVSLGLAFLALFVFLNILYMANGKYSLSHVWNVLTHWNETRSGLAGDQATEIKQWWFNIGATLLAGMGMSMGAIATQSLTKNPIAEGSTLGLVQASIFGLIFLLSFGTTTLMMKYLFIFIFGTVGALVLLVFMVFNKSKNKTQKIILAGLAIGIIFKTLTFIFKTGNQNLNVVSFAYVLGGAEAISKETLAIQDKQLATSLIISGSMILVSLILLIINIKGMNLLEIGDERAKNLGSSIMRTRVINVLITMLSIPASVLIVGNMAFLGLFSVHAARWMMKSRNMKKVLPATLMIGLLLSTLGLQLTEHLPSINSGLWMTFIGAPYLIYIGIRGLK